eukprot:scaffold30909_cov42-Prasinocladus_malaysianus.AAC.1
MKFQPPLPHEIILCSAMYQKASVLQAKLPNILQANNATGKKKKNLKNMSSQRTTHGIMRLAEWIQTLRS